MKILIVDDSLLDRKLLVNLLKKSGIENEIVQAANGEEAIKILLQDFQDICLIILDWQMPVMNGLGFMKSVANVPKINEIPIVMITASSSQENRDLARSVNPRLAGYLIKPYTTEKLIETISPHLKP